MTPNSTATLERRPAPPADRQRPRLLFLCQTLPFPPDGGVNIRSYNVLRLLAREFDVTALCFYRQATRPSAELVQASLDGLGIHAVVEAFPIPQERSRSRLLWDHARSVLSGRVYTRYAYASEAFAARVDALVREGRFDLVHVDSLDLSYYLPRLHGLPVVCTHHNVESALLRRRAATEHSWFRRLYCRLQASLMEREERQYCPRVALNAVVSEPDRQALERIAPGSRVVVVPNGVDTDAFRPADGGAAGLVFVGGHSWFPNRDAMRHFADDVLPLVRERSGDVAVRWVGRAPPGVAESYRAHGIELTGYVDDIRPHVHAAACYVVPLRVGGGTRLKILDAWAMGKAVVSTSIGCEGLDAVDGHNILIRDTPAGFADAVHAVLTDEALRRRLGAAARATAETEYEWTVIGERMRREYRALALRGGSAARGIGQA